MSDFKCVWLWNGNLPTSSLAPDAVPLKSMPGNIPGIPAHVQPAILSFKWEAHHRFITCPNGHPCGYISHCLMTKLRLHATCAMQPSLSMVSSGSLWFQYQYCGVAVAVKWLIRVETDIVTYMPKQLKATSCGCNTWHSRRVPSCEQICTCN